METIGALDSSQFTKTTPAEPDRGPWGRFLRVWGAAGGAAVLAVVVAFGLMTARAGTSSLPSKYNELFWATKVPVLYRLGSVADLAVWTALGGLFVAFGSLLARSVRVRSMLLIACGFGQMAGVIGSFIRLEGITHLAAQYAGAGVAERSDLLRSTLDLTLLANIHYAAGSVLWTTGLLLVASVVWRIRHFPRPLAIVMVVTALLNMVTDVYNMVSSGNAGDGVGLLAVLGLAVVFFGVAHAFRARGDLRSATSAAQADSDRRR